MQPFRSEEEALREQLRRAEERGAYWEAQALELETQIELGGQPRRKLMALAVITTILSLGMFVATTYLNSRDREQLLAQLSDDYKRLEAERAQRSRIDSNLSKSDLALVACKHEIQASYRDRAWPKCQCEPGDPLCSCFDDFRSFEHAWAVSQVDATKPALEVCLRTRREVSVDMTTDVMENGDFYNVRITPLADGTLSSEEDRCMTNALQSWKPRLPSERRVHVQRTFKLGR